MRVLFIHKNFPAQFLHLAPAMAARGHEVTALATNRHPAPPGVKVIHYAPTREPAQNLHPWLLGMETQLIRADAVAEAALALRKSGYVPDLVCAHTAWGEALFIKDAWPETRLLSLFELYYELHGGFMAFDPEFTPEDPRLWMYARMKNAGLLLSLDAADHGISATRFQRDTLPAPYRPRVSVCHEGVDTDVLCPNEAATCNLPDGTRLTRQDEVITFVARDLEPVRGYHAFMRALPGILAARPRAQVLVVGGDGVSYGWQPPAGRTWKAMFLDEVKDRIDLSRVHFLGLQPRETLTLLLQLSSVHVYLTYPYVLSWSMLEAMSCGALLVGSDTAPVREVIRDGENGLLVDFFSPEALCAAVCRVLDHPDRLRAMREAGRRTVIGQYDMRRVCVPRQVAIAEAVAEGRPVPG